MTLALYGKSRKRQTGLLFGGMMAAFMASIMALTMIGTALAHHAAYTATRTCDSAWTANADYVGGASRRLVLIRDVTINGVDYAASWSNSAADPPPNDSADGGSPIGTNQVILRSAYTGSTTGLPADTGDPDFLWVGVDPGFDIFSRSGVAGTFVGGAANWAGTIELYSTNGTTWTKQSGESVTITEPVTTAECNPEIEVVKNVHNSGGNTNDPQDFAFTVTRVGEDSGFSPAAFSLDDDGADGNPLSNEQDLTLPPVTGAGDTYVITEGALPAGWTLSSISCSGFEESVNLAARTVTLSGVENDDDIVCTFNNLMPPPVAKLWVKKVIVGGGHADVLFPVTINNAGDNGAGDTEGDGAGNTSVNTPYFQQWDDDGGDDDFVVTEGPLPAGWTVNGKSIIAGANATCPLEGGTWTTTTPAVASYADGSNALDDIDDGDNVTVCFRNVPPSTVTKAKDTGADANKLYWTVSVTNLAVSQQVAISDSGATYESVSGGTCSDTTFDPFIVCTKTVSVGTLSVKVSKAKPAATCQPQEVNNSATAYLGASNTAPVIGTAGGTEDTKYTIAGDPALCGSVTWVKSSGNLNPSVGDVHVDWTFDVTNTSGVPGSVTVFDADTSFVNSTCSNQPNVEIANDTYKCDIAASPNPPSSYGVQFIVRGPALQINPKCDNYQATNEAWVPGNFNSSDTAQVNHTATGPAKDCISVTKTQDALGVTGGKAYWNVNVVNTFDSAVDINVKDVDATKEAVVSGGTCNAGDTIMGNGLNCTVDANSTLIIRVSKTVPVATCDSQELPNTAWVFMGHFETAPASNPDFTASGTAYTIPGEGSAACLTVTKTAGTATPPTWTINITSTADVTVPFWVVDVDGIYGGTTGDGTCGANIGDSMTNGIACSVTANDSMSIIVTKAMPSLTCAGTDVSNSAQVWFGAFNVTPTAAPDFTPDGGTHQDVGATPALCGSVIEICKLWQTADGGDPGTVSNFGFDVSDTSETEAVTIFGVTEGSEASCIEVFVLNGPVNISEDLLVGFLNPSWVVEDLVPSTTTVDSGTGYTIDTIFVGPNGCSSQLVLVDQILGLVREIQAVVVPPPQGSGEPVCRITFTNKGDSEVEPAGDLRVEKYLDINGDGDANDPGEGFINGWDMEIHGDDFNGTVATSVDGSVNIPGLISGDVYTVDEEVQTGFSVTNVTVNGVSQGAFTFAQTTIPEGGVTVVRFFNKPDGETIIAHKVAQTSHNGGPNIDAPGDDDGWLITVRSVNCAINITLPTDSNGNATFTNLPLCSDYVVSENTVNAASPGFVPASPISFSGQTPSGQTLTFVNRRATFDPPCTTCGTTTPTATPTTPTATPTTPTTTTTTTPPTNTPTNTPTATPTTPVSDVQGERTPGITPIAPSTGGGLMGGTAGGFNFLLIIAGFIALTSGLGFVAIARKAR